MVQHAHKTRDLAPEERVVIERLLGRPLREEEEFEVIAWQPVDLNARREALAGIRELAKGKHISMETIREWIEDGRL